MKTKAGIKSLLLVGLGLTLLTSCQNKEQEEKEQLARMRDLVEQTAEDTEERVEKEKEAIHSEMNAALDEIDHSLELINQQRGLMVKGPDGVGSDVSSSKKEQILGNIAIMNELINENEKKIKNLQARLKKTSGSNKELEERLAQYEQKNKDAEAQLASLSDQLTKERQKNEMLAKEITDKNAAYADLQTRYTKAEDDAYSVYYIAGSRNQLKKMKITEGNIFDRDISPAVKASSFNKVDSRTTANIPVKAKKVRLVTDHDKNSYKIVEKEKGLHELTITDPITFWKTSKYLVIETRS